MTAPPRSRGRPADLAAHVAHCRSRALQDALAEATASHWLRRANTFELARPRANDYTGRATPEDLAAQDRRLAERSLACRRHADVAPLADDGALVHDALREVA